MSSKRSRQNKLIEIIKSQGIQPVRELANILDVSEMTVRRDLEDIGSLTVPKGNTISQDVGNHNLLSVLEKFNEQKSAIGKMAASLISPNDVIIVDTGSTVFRMVQFLPANYNLTVLCYNANVLFELRHRQDITILFCGGLYHPKTEMFESSEGIQYIKRLRANKVFLSAAGVHEDLGITCENMYEVITKQAVIQYSREKILMIDSSKFGEVKSSFFCEISEIDSVITDQMIPEYWRNLLRRKKINLSISDTENRGLMHG